MKKCNYFFLVSCSTDLTPKYMQSLSTNANLLQSTVIVLLVVMNQLLYDDDTGTTWTNSLHAFHVRLSLDGFAQLVHG